MFLQRQVRQQTCLPTSIDFLRAQSARDSSQQCLTTNDTPEIAETLLVTRSGGDGDGDADDDDDGADAADDADADAEEPPWRR